MKQKKKRSAASELKRLKAIENRIKKRLEIREEHAKTCGCQNSMIKEEKYFLTGRRES